MHIAMTHIFHSTLSVLPIYGHLQAVQCLLIGWHRCDMTYDVMIVTQFTDLICRLAWLKQISDDNREKEAVIKTLKSQIIRPEAVNYFENMSSLCWTSY